jgi:hypothetical protein
VAATEGEVVTMYELSRQQEDQRLMNELYYEWDIPVDVSRRPVWEWHRGLITLEEFAVALDVDDATIWAAVEACGGGVSVTRY